MPQGRSKAFSGKKKKMQMQAKRHRLTERGAHSGGGDGKAVPPDDDDDDGRGDRQPPSLEVGGGAGGDSMIVSAASSDKRTALTQGVNLAASASAATHQGRQRYDLMFKKETKEEIAKLRLEARNEVEPMTDEQLESALGDYFPDDMTFPQRPKWTRDMSKRQLEQLENDAFVDFVSAILRDYDDVSHFELNLETWRQLWRVIEVSDVLLLILDCRYPAAMFPPSLYTYITSRNKDMIVVLNKVDLVPMSLAVAWKHKFLESYPRLRVTFFSSFPSYNLRTSLEAGASEQKGGIKSRRLRGRISMVTDGAQQVFKVCQDIVSDAGANVDLDSWQELIVNADSRKDDDEVKVEEHVKTIDEDALGEENVERFREGILKLGMIGQPNAGKSSLINSLMGRRVVSVSKTPGHTKHFQDIFVTRSVRLRDCPGLVFPSLVPKALQVVMGSYPISQLREMFSVVQYVAQRVNLPLVLKLTHPDALREADREDLKWSAFSVAEAWAMKRGYVTARSNRPDLNRAANHILRMCLEGKIPLTMYPVNYVKTKDHWAKHEDTAIVKKLLGLDDADAANLEPLEESSPSEDEENTSGDEDDHRFQATNVANRFGALGSVDSDE